MPGWNLLLAYQTAAAHPPIIPTIVIASSSIRFRCGPFHINYDYRIIAKTADIMLQKYYIRMDKMQDLSHHNYIFIAI